MNEKRETKGDKPPTRAEIETTLLCLLNVARLAQLGPSDNELRRYIDAASRVETVAPILDPAMWRKGSKKNDCFLKIARALATFRASLPTREEAEEADHVADSFRSRDAEEADRVPSAPRVADSFWSRIPSGGK